MQARSFDGDVRARVPDNVFRRLRPGGYYIPAVAMRLGAVETELPLGDIARKIVAVVERTASRSTSVARG